MAGECIPKVSTINVLVVYDVHEEDLSLLVVTGDRSNFMGRDWLDKFKVNLANIHSLAPHTTLNEVLNRHSSVFSEGLGCLKEDKVQLRVDDKTDFRFFKPRSVPFLLRNKVVTELERLVALGIISPIEFSKWAHPIVSALKKTAQLEFVRILKSLLTKCHKLNDSYPLPKVVKLFGRLSGVKYFSKLDLSQA